MSKNKKILLIVVGCIVLLSFLKLLFIGSYTACGCGCCQGTLTTEIKFTLNPDKIIEGDRDSAKKDNCMIIDCSSGIKYYYFNFTRKTE